MKKFSEVLIRCSFALGFSLFAIFFLSYAVGFLAFLLGLFSISSPISVPSQCRIVSSSVDLRTSKICELGFLNYKAKRVFYPSEKRKFRCRYDYYWASVFKVEYRDHFSGQVLLGLAEVPKEALPGDCRPNFSSAWSTKHMLKVNETYDCWYTSGRSKVEILQDGYFGCEAKDPSAFEMMRRYAILSMKMLQSWLSGQLKAKPKLIGLEVVAGVIAGFLTPIILMISFTICKQLLFRFPRSFAAIIASLIRRLLLSRVFFLLTYFAFVGWVAIQYGNMLGLGDLFVDY